MDHPNSGKIRVLPETLANQIAAGEVVERPASVVKELVENSIDAEARRIQIDIELGGRRLIRILDDGHGMSREDAVLAFERHATSKIASLEDLAAIITLGFRGEALASIASVAKVELKTKTVSGDAATLVQIEGGRVVDVKDAARDTGTTITVRDLFFNVPARRKFMRSEATENFHLTNIVTHYALAHPEIAFTLTNNGREVLRVSPAKNLRERAYQIFGPQIIESLLPVRGGREFVAEISGFVSAPRERRTTRDSQYFFVNRRFVRDKTIAGGLLEGYRSILPHGVYPVALLFIDVPIEEIDVNVHPAKTEIRFRRTEAVKDAIAEAVRTALARAGISSEAPEPRVVAAELSVDSTVSTPRAEATPVEQAAMEFPLPPVDGTQPAISVIPGPSTFVTQPEQSPQTDMRSDDNEPVDSTTFEIEAQRRFELPLSTETTGATPQYFSIPTSSVQTAAELPPVNSAAHLLRPSETTEAAKSKIRPIAQLHDSFIIAVDDEGLLLIDQHVAHERILFDRFRKSESERSIESQSLLLPETLDLSPAQMVAFELVENELAALGFGVMRLSGRTIAIKSIPVDLPSGEVRNFLAEMLNAVEPEKRGTAKRIIRDDIAASLACKAAVKINMTLTPEKMQWLVDRLLTTSSPTTCPHGRPVILRLTMKDIERGFHRS